MRRGAGPAARAAQQQQGILRDSDGCLGLQHLLFLPPAAQGLILHMLMGSEEQDAAEGKKRGSGLGGWPGIAAAGRSPKLRAPRHCGLAQVTFFLLMAMKEKEGIIRPVALNPWVKS